MYRHAVMGFKDEIEAARTQRRNGIPIIIFLDDDVVRAKIPFMNEKWSEERLTCGGSVMGRRFDFGLRFDKSGGIIETDMSEPELKESFRWAPMHWFGVA
ncbi:MAG: hypothetical protein Q4B65_01455, partial [Candidatus Saccharibacteria bacterium]|nr:hypothetical protein [Candidatus Saccharibacteria bacterium]